METLEKRGSETQIATFHIDKELFGIGIHRIKEIVRYPEITHVPRSAVYLKGLTNLRGNVLPVLDARIRLGLPVSEVTDRTRVLVLDVNESLVGVIVDNVKGVASLENVKVEVPPPILSSGIDSRYIQNVIQSNKDESITLELNVETLCDIEKGHLQAQSSGAVHGAEAIGNAGDKKSTVSERQLVTFLVAQEEYGFPIHSVQEILRVSKITEVPDVPEFVLGVLSLRNQLLPIIDIRKLFHMPSLVENKLYEIEKLQKAYEQWFSNFKYSIQSGTFNVASIDSVEAIHWIETFRTSSEMIGNVLQKIRFLHQDIKFHALQILKSKENVTSQQLLEIVEVEIQGVFGQLVNALDECKNFVQREIKEDQRILVVDVNGNSIGIMVDRMQQVIRVSENIIDPPPRIIHTDKQDNLQGIVKLEDGKRLILLMDEKKIFNEELMSRLASVNTSNSGDGQHDKIGGEGLSQDEVQLVTFRLGKEEFGLLIEDVREINRLSGVTAVPNAPSFVEGIMNLRGNVVPAIDLRKRFHMETIVHGESTRVVIVDIEEKTTGLIVDSVSDVIRVPKKSIEPPPDIISSKVETEFIAGIGNLTAQGRFIILLNVNKILSDEEVQMLKQG